MKRLVIILFLFTFTTSIAQKPDKTYLALERTYIALNVLDYGTTQYFLHNGGVELNPIASNMTPLEMGALKIGSTALTIGLARILHKDHPKAAKVMMVGVNLVMGAVVSNNIGVCLRLSKK